ncbi:hypothetical protein AL066_27830 [Pseudomonas nunensis]|nr:hypothetical protein AL066_27830 [Pseudomonas nunensis]
MRKVSVGSLDALIRHTQANDRSRGGRAGAEIIGISLCATECGVLACSINSCGHMANQLSAPLLVGARLAGEGVLEIAFAGKPRSYRAEGTK